LVMKPAWTSGAKRSMTDKSGSGLSWGATCQEIDWGVTKYIVNWAKCNSLAFFDILWTPNASKKPTLCPLKRVFGCF
jgi:hypothetical protein